MTTYPPYLSPVDDGTLSRPELAKQAVIAPTPLEVAKSITTKTDDVAHVPVVDVPMRDDQPAAAPLSHGETFTVVVAMNDAHASKLRYEGITHWRVYDGSLTLYTVDRGRTVRYVSIAPHEWWGVERLLDEKGDDQ